ncbi:MAG: redox-sensing transcriptional repressor Rex, partial [Acidimicrobiia bacterium]|nr:redox-sensing transcriptional repressor Rex [Acidimicrobiia bacterium]
DNDPAKIGTTVSGVAVHPVGRLAALVRELAVAVGVITTPAGAAQEVADALVDAGVTSILNFTAHPIAVPGHVVVRRVDLATELQILSFYQQRGLASSTGVGVPLETP